ncbi:MAG: hypothetical protein AB1894_02945 [Chloroflexota bacterium]
MKGRSLPRDVLRDVINITYKDNVNEIDSFEFLVNNWDAGKRTFKYVGLPDDLSSGPNSPFTGIFSPGEKVEVWLGYQGNLRRMVVGEITTMELDFSGSNAPTVLVRGLNTLHNFRKKQHTWSWEGKRDSDVAKEMGGQPVSDDRPGLGVPVRIDSNAAQDEPEEPILFMNNQYDIFFLMERARVRGYVVYVAEDEKTGENYIYFGPSQHVKQVTYKLEWGKSLIDFRPALATANQVYEVTVRGLDRRSRKPIVKTVHWGDQGVDINLDQKAAIQAVKDRKEVITDRPVHTAQQAQALARDILLRRLKEMIKGSGSVVGLPDLRAGRKIHIKGIGQQFSGEYFVLETTHRISDAGYITSFTACREKGLPK